MPDAPTAAGAGTADPVHGAHAPLLFDVLDPCPTLTEWKSRGRASEVDLGGYRDRALLLVGFVGALRRSELAALTVEDVSAHPHGAVLRSAVEDKSDR